MVPDRSGKKLHFSDAAIRYQIYLYIGTHQFSEVAEMVGVLTTEGDMQGSILEIFAKTILPLKRRMSALGRSPSVPRWSCPAG